jgi:hypothetical protein
MDNPQKSSKIPSFRQSLGKTFIGLWKTSGSLGKTWGKLWGKAWGKANGITG